MLYHLALQLGALGCRSGQRQDFRDGSGRSRTSSSEHRLAGLIGSRHGLPFDEELTIFCAAGNGGL